MPWGRAFVIFFFPGAGHCHAFPARPPGIVNLKKKKVQMPGGCPWGGWAMLELTDALRLQDVFLNEGGGQTLFCIAHGASSPRSFNIYIFMMQNMDNIFNNSGKEALFLFGIKHEAFIFRTQ